MSYVTVLWSACAAAALLLALLHGLAWIYDRRAYANLAFAVAASCLAGGAAVELAMLRAQTPQEYGELVWWLQLPIFGLVVGIALFLRLYLRAGSVWLLTPLIALRAFILALNAFSDPNFNFAHIDSLAQIPFLGEQVMVVARAATGEGQWLGLLATVLFALFILDVGITVMRRNAPTDRRGVAIIVAPMLAAVVLSAVLSQLVFWRVVDLPILFVPPFLIALAAMTIELTRDVLSASRLARDLRDSERRLELATSAAGESLSTPASAAERLGATESAHPTVDTATDVLRWIALRGSFDLHASDVPERVRRVVSDVARQRQAEEEVGELRQKLAHAGRVTMLGQLVPAIAHELSQPLAAIQNNAEAAQMLLARDTVDTRVIREIIDDVLRDDRRAVNVLQRLRMWLRQGRINMEVVSLHELAQEVVTLVRSEASSKRVVIDCDVPDTLPQVHADRVHLSQVLLNLIMNAIEAVNTGTGVQRRVSIEAHTCTNDCCEVSVSDTGPGVSPDQLDRIFEPFVTAKPGGMGIGLSISRSIVEAHGGKLWAESSTGGARFHFTLPLHTPEPMQAAQLARPA